MCNDYSVEQAIRNFRKDRPILDKANSDEFLIQYLLTEARELAEAPPEERIQELADIFFLAFSLADNLGVEATAIVMEKLAFNMIRYEARFFQEGDYQEKRKMVKAREKDLKLKEAFYE